MGEIAKVVRGGSPRPIENFLTSSPDGLSWLKIGDVDKEAKYIYSTKERILPAGLHKTREVNPGDFILSNSMSFGRPYILKIKTCIHDGWIAITKLEHRISKDYLYYALLTPFIQNYFLSSAAGTGVRNLNIEIIQRLNIPFAFYSEQKKIADCLSCLDELIEAIVEKAERLKKYKKGLIQRLFPKEGETTPRLRFFEFQNAPAWEEKKLGEVANIITGSTPRTSNLEYYGGDIQFVSPADLGEHKYILKTFKSLTKKGLKVSRPIRKGAVLFSCIGIIGKVGIAQKELVSNQQINAVIPNKNLLDEFSYYLLIRQTPLFQALGAVQVVPIINKSAFGSVLMLIPSFLEQKKIADCLSSLDELIAATAEKAEQLKKYKKALMQKLFPA